MWRSVEIHGSPFHRITDSDLVAELSDFTDLWLYDLKHPDPVRHAELTGVDRARVSVKAATGNLSADEGAGRVISATCLVSVESV